MPTADAVRLSVVVPAYNEAAFLPATLTSLARQDYPGGYEVIVVDNASTDDTAAVAARHGARVVHEASPGVCAARQAGTDAARGAVVVSTDADTVHPPDWLSRIDAAFAASDSVVAVAGPCRYQHPSWWARLYPALLFGAVAGFRRLTGRVVYVTATNTAFRRSAFPGYDTRLTQGGDELDLLRRLRGRGRVEWLSGNAVVTSPRRLEQGLLYTVFVSLLAQYLLGYLLNRITSSTVVGMAPAFRPRPPTQPSSSRAEVLAREVEPLELRERSSSTIPPPPKNITPAARLPSTVRSVIARRPSRPRASNPAQ